VFSIIQIDVKYLSPKKSYNAFVHSMKRQILTVSVFDQLENQIHATEKWGYISR